MIGDPQGPRRTLPRTLPDADLRGDPRARLRDPTSDSTWPPDAPETDGAGRWRKGMGVEPT